MDFVGKSISLWPRSPGTVLDVGSMDVNGTCRPIFETLKWKYVGCDVEAGKNVDRVADATALVSVFGEESFDCVVSCETLEHMFDPIRAVEQMVKVLKPKGLLILTAAGNGFMEHRHPVDCWRPMPDGMKYLLRDLEDIHVESHSVLAPPWIVGRGWKR